MKVSVCCLNSSPARCVAVPVPPEAKLIWPGRALAIAMYSFTLCALSLGLTASTSGEEPIRATGVKSLSASYGVL